MTDYLKIYEKFKDIKEVKDLGHSSPNATQPYLSIDFNGLKKCALDLSFIPLSGGELY